MGVIGDIFRLMRGEVRQSANIDYAANLKHSADLADQFAGADPNQPLGTHGAASANPFTNMTAYGSMLQGSGTVVSLAPTGAEVTGTPVYAVVLDVVVPGRDPYRTTYQTVLAQAALPKWQPGASYPFRVSPTDPHALMLG